ncbi:MAG: MBL fold metallo-hydrolase, partial [Actinobacteria bacterium]|nr:MBL fold metallo-hydrolase [Actinomycetota bacterium]
MQCFRLSHAGVVLELDGASLFVDPGSFSSGAELSTAIEAAAPIAGIVITHEHADHWTRENLVALRATAPDAPMFTTQATADALAAAGIHNVLVV